MPKERSDLEKEFVAAMLRNYETAARLKPPIISDLFREGATNRGKEYAEHLLTTSKPGQGFERLWPDHMKLSLEYLVLQQKWRSLFSDELLKMAEARLREVKCNFPSEDGL